jgi:hypothetical protein
MQVAATFSRAFDFILTAYTPQGISGRALETTTVCLFLRKETSGFRFPAYVKPNCSVLTIP